MHIANQILNIHFGIFSRGDQRHNVRLQVWILSARHYRNNNLKPTTQNKNQNFEPSHGLEIQIITLPFELKLPNSIH